MIGGEAIAFEEIAGGGDGMVIYNPVSKISAEACSPPRRW
jgi:hypothetical protein